MLESLKLNFPLWMIFAVMFVTGCGPMEKPMVDRLEDDDQQKVDDAWNRALSPVTNLDRQAWLDMMVVARAYQHGVDKLYLRAEKNFAGGSAVMEIKFDRTKPNDDVFHVQVLDKNDVVIRSEEYSRKEVDETYEFFFSNSVPADGQEEQELIAEREKRIKVISEYFPQDEENQQQEAPAEDQ